MNKTSGYKFNTGRDPSPNPQFGNLVRPSGIMYPRQIKTNANNSFGSYFFKSSFILDSIYT